MSPLSGPDAAGTTPVTLPRWYAARRGSADPLVHQAGSADVPVPRAGSADLLVRLDAARDLADGPDRVDRLTELAAEADAAGPPELALAVRVELLDALDRAGTGWRMPSVLRRCRSTVEEIDPGTADLLDHFQRRIVALAVGTLRITLDVAYAMLADLERRDPAGTPGLVGLRAELAAQAGDEPAATDALLAWLTTTAPELITTLPDISIRRTPANLMIDLAGQGVAGECAACVACRQADVLADRATRPGTGPLTGRDADAAAIRVVEPVLAGRSQCPEQPERALAATVLPLLRLGRYAEAAAAHVTAYRRHRDELAAFPRMATHLRFCALAEHPARGLDILLAQRPRLAGAVDDRSRMEFAAAGTLVCRRTVGAGVTKAGATKAGVTKAGATEASATEASATVAGSAASLDPSDVASLGAELLATARDLADRFDARNGGDHQRRRLAGWWAEPPPATGPAPSDETQP
ncbi:hypothetical protein [Plantactinospora sp. GCM10030261]|uniref:hypothetical protein n=1 Tax=Plantactinospora sp. GCM10030261 TaxID=3273420 RepID=UPI00360A2C5E